MNREKILKLSFDNLALHNLAQSDVLSDMFNSAIKALLNGDLEHALQICDDARDMFWLILKGCHLEKLLETIGELREMISFIQRYDGRLSIHDFNKIIHIEGADIYVDEALLNPHYNNDAILAALDLQQS